MFCINIKVVRNLFSKLGQGPYWLAVKFLIFSSKLFGLGDGVWARNSYKLKALEPGFSDIDITICLTNSKNTTRLGLFLSFYAGIKKLFPFFGEVNVYRPSMMGFLLENHNGFELMRDPVLCEKFNLDRTKDPVEAAVFLFRQLEADIYNLQNYPEKRIKKWESHINMINKALPELKLKEHIPFNKNKLIETATFSIIFLNNIWDPFEVEELKEKLYFYFELVSKGVDFERLQYLMNKDSWFISWKSFRNLDEEKATNILSDKQLAFLIRQIRWEVSGVLTQIKSKKEALTATGHFNKTIGAVKKITRLRDSEEAQVLLGKINEAIMLLKTI